MTGATSARREPDGLGRKPRLTFDRQAIDDAKARYNITDIARRWLAKPPKRTGHEWVGLCLLHQERTPSMRLNDAKGTFHCFGCGASGDLVKLVMDYLKIDFVEAMQWLGAAELPPVDETQRAKELEGQRRARIEDIQLARSIFADADDLKPGTHGAIYLEARGIVLPVPPTLRIAEFPSYRNPETRAWGRPRPCIVGGCQDATGTFVGIQRIYYRDDDPGLGKADCKLSLGQVKGAALRLGPVQPHIHLCEGPEDSLSVRQECGDDRSIWAALGTGLMPFIGLPPEITDVTILSQNNAAGKKAAAVTSEAFLAKGLSVREACPTPEYDDWNDMLRGIRR